MYRITFDLHTSTFVVQLLWSGMIWMTAKKDGKPLSFPNYNAALSWADLVGLDKAYHRQDTQKAYYAQGVAR